jgi:NitT/TauT family transport system ATP-binding protein
MDGQSISSSPFDGLKTTQTGYIQINKVSKHFETKDGVLPAVQDFSLSIKPGSFVSIVGPSGCGKSTLLSMIAGLMPVTDGVIEVNGCPVDGVPPGIGFLFQRDALLPWKTVLENIMLAPLFRRWSRKRALEEARCWLFRVMLERFADHYPNQLSGGMRKRVTLAQTLIFNPTIILMDEPFSGLDAQTRKLLENDLAELCLEGGRTVLFVTHDLEEAIALSDEVVMMTARPGKVKTVYPVSLARPRDLNKIQFDQHFTDIHALLWQDLCAEVGCTSEGTRR